jgi:hypothetical protein
MVASWVVAEQLGVIFMLSGWHEAIRGALLKVLHVAELLEMINPGEFLAEIRFLASAMCRAA